MAKCDKCGKIEYIRYNKDGKTSCPICEGFKILSKTESLRIVNKQCNDMELALTNHLKKFDKNRLLIWIFNEREKISAGFLKGIPMIELGKFLSMTYLIKKVMDLPKEEMGNLKADDLNTKELIGHYEFFLNFLSRKHSIEEDWTIYGIKRNTGKILEDFVPLYHDSWRIILDSFAGHLILSKDKGDEYFEENKDEYQKLIDNPPTPENFSPEETIKRLFQALITFRVALQKNKEFGKIFDLNYLKTLMISPDRLLTFIKEAFPDVDDLIHQSNKSQFLSFIKKYFPILRKEKVYRGIVFSENNLDIFPLFLEIDGNVFTSRSFVKVMCIFYYSIFYKKLFDAELSRQGKIFEDIEFPEKLDLLDFKYTLNVSDNPKKKSIQIDCIAWKNGILYVIELKVWDIKPFFEHRNIHADRERDLKGVVDGYEYSTKIEEDGTKTVIKKDKPSLIKKINYIKDNIEKHCEDFETIKEIKGVVITKSIPPLEEYKKIKFLGFLELEKLN